MSTDTIWVVWAEANTSADHDYGLIGAYRSKPGAEEARRAWIAQHTEELVYPRDEDPTILHQKSCPILSPPGPRGRSRDEQAQHRKNAQEWCDDHCTDLEADWTVDLHVEEVLLED